MGLETTNKHHNYFLTFSSNIRKYKIGRSLPCRPRSHNKKPLVINTATEMVFRYNPLRLAGFMAGGGGSKRREKGSTGRAALQATWAGLVLQNRWQPAPGSPGRTRQSPLQRHSRVKDQARDVLLRHSRKLVGEHVLQTDQPHHDLLVGLLVQGVADHVEFDHPPALLQPRCLVPGRVRREEVGLCRTKKEQNHILEISHPLMEQP